MLTFYGNLFLLAMRAIPSSLGSNWLGLIWPAVVVAVGEIIACVVYGWRTMIEKWKQATLIGLASLGMCYLLLFTCCALRTNYDVYADVNSKKEISESLLNSASERQRYAVLEAQTECAREIGKNETLDKQNRDQQSTINNCQTQALKLLTPEALNIIPIPLSKDGQSPTPTQRTAQFLLLTNKAISPVDMEMQCDQIFQMSMFGGAEILGAYPQMGGSGVTAPKTANISINSPAWTPKTPMRITVYYNGNQDINCRFRER